MDPTRVPLPGSPRDDGSYLEDFVYEPLQGEYAFRLLDLHPGSPSDELMVTLGPGRVGSCRFTAVSYCWGSKDRPRRLKCGVAVAIRSAEGTIEGFTPAEEPRGVLSVTESVEGLLRNIRDEELYVTLWIDSICINQADVAEKTGQVRMMNLIYNNAAATIVYLGAPDADTELAFKAARALAHMKHLPPDALPKRPEERLDLLPEDVRDEISSNPVMTRRAFLGLIRRPWFGRIWVVQELILSQRALVVSGPHRIPWPTLADACKVVRDGNMYELDPSTMNCDWVVSLERRRSTLLAFRKRRKRQAGGDDGAGGRGADSGADGGDGDTRQLSQREMQEYALDMNLAQLQMRTRHCGATDPRDKVFALLNLAVPGAGGEGIQPTIDYNLSVAEVYVQAARYWVHSQPARPLQFLSCVDGHREPAGGGGGDDGDDDGKARLPSWVPDWRDGLRGGMLGHVRVPNGKGAAMQARPVVRFPEIPRPFSLPLHLSVRGFPLTMEIQEVEKIKMPGDSWRAGRHSAMLNRFTGPYPTTIMSYQQAFVSTVDPTPPQTFSLDGLERPFSYWRRERARAEGKALRPTRVAGDDGTDSYVTIEFPAELEARVDEATGQRHVHTQEQLYGSLPIYFRLQGAVPQMSLTHHRLFFVSANGFMGLAPESARAGDLVCVMLGMATPVVLRPKRRADDGAAIFSFVGECFVYGLMNGEALEDLPLQMVMDFVLE